MIEVDITDDSLLQAIEKAIEMGELKNSITGGEGNIAGFLGEILVADMTGWAITNTYDYDLVTTDGRKVDVKTKRTNYAPREYYDCSVAAYNTKQKCDVYVFVRVKNDFSKAWILGQKNKDDYFNEARFLKKDQKDGDNDFVVKADCYNLQIDKLDSLYK